MARNGFNCKMGPLPTLLFDLVNKNAQVAWEDKMKVKMGGKEATKDEIKKNMIRDRKFVECACFLVMECGFDVNYFR